MHQAIWPGTKTDYQVFETSEKVGDGHTVDTFGTGNAHFKTLFEVSQPKKPIMYKVPYVPQLACNVLSVRAASSNGNFLKFGHSRCWIHGSNVN